MSDISPLENMRVVLVSPIYGGNIGATCRAMKNCGITDLAIVAPHDSTDMKEAHIRAYHAADILEARREYPTLSEAVTDCGLVAGTSARQGLYRGHAKTPKEWAPTLLKAAAQAPVALVFGTEDKGLSNEDIALCTQIIRIPSSPLYTSLNLSHAVMICCYEIYVAHGEFEPIEEWSPEAPSGVRERMFSLWREALFSIGFMEEEKADHMMLGLRRILSRGLLTESDVKILMGIARQTQWSAGELEKLRGTDHPQNP